MQKCAIATSYLPAYSKHSIIRPGRLSNVLKPLVRLTESLEYAHVVPNAFRTHFRMHIDLDNIDGTACIPEIFIRKCPIPVIDRFRR